ncbi:MAG: hypothetical protein H7287_05760 [Thermoleophilia bacterium]|nr:hypothetical protein [Thermoleophilia bacterium]
MRTRLIAFALLLTSSPLLAACGSTNAPGDSQSSGSAATPATTNTTVTASTNRAARVQAETATSGAGFAGCIEDFGFAAMPPAHGIAAQWKEPKSGAVLAISSDESAAAMATVTAQFTRGSYPAIEVGTGIIVSGGTPADLVQGITHCAPLR